MRKIGEGTKSEVFLLPDGRILKLALAPYTALAADEATILTHLERAGVRAPRVVETVQIGGRLGLVFDNVTVGATLSHVVHSRPWRIRAAACHLAALHLAVHARSAPELASQRERIEEQIHAASVVSHRARQAALEVLRDLPDDEAACHNDMHMLNVIVDAGGTMMIIDWALATRGNPLADVATAALQLRFGELRGQPLTRAAVEAGRALFCRAYVQRYLELSPGATAELTRWELPVAVALAGRREGRMREQLLRRVAQRLSEPSARGRFAARRPGVVPR